MPKRFIHLAFFFFIITALSGLLMRVAPFMNHSLIPYSHVLHGHSHIAILGWAFLGSFLILLAMLWPSIKNKRHSILLIFTIFIVSLLMFIAFLVQGYGLFSIILSTLHIFVEYWAIIFIYQQFKSQNIFSAVSKLYLKGSLIALLISSIGPFALAYISANQLQDSVVFDMAVYFYLHFQYNGWLSLFLMGTFLLILHRKGIKVHTSLLKSGFWMYFISLFPWYFLSILWVDLGSFSYALATIGSLGQWIGIMMIIIGINKFWGSIKSTMPMFTTISLIITFILLFLKSLMELGLIAPSLADLVYETRSVIVGYLHFTLLGFISLFILTQYQMIWIIDTARKAVTIGYIIFYGGFLLNEFLLFTMGLTSWLNVMTLPYYMEGLLIASILLTVGIGTIWYNTLTTNEKSGYK